MADKVLFRQPGEALLVDVQVREGRGRGTLRQKSANRFAFVKAKGRDVDQTSDVRCIRAQGSDDLATVGVAGDDGRAVLAVQYLAQPGDVIGQGGLRELGAVTL